MRVPVDDLLGWTASLGRRAGTSMCERPRRKFCLCELDHTFRRISGVTRRRVELALATEEPNPCSGYHRLIRICRVMISRR